jgi:preprotein translocase subunit SecY
METLLKLQQYLPEILPPAKKLDIFAKIRWTLFGLLIFFILGYIPIWGLTGTSAERFSQLALILGASIGSIITLGIGPIVSASIILQLLVGGGLINVDFSTQEGRAKFQALQRIFVLIFVVLESISFTLLGGLTPYFNGLLGYLIIIIQLIIGGLLIYYLDDFLSKYGIGSGISLFILAGVSKNLIVKLLSPFKLTEASEEYVGALWNLIHYIISGNLANAKFVFISILITLFVFFLATYLSSIKIEIPLSIGQFRTRLIKWPISFFYTSTIPIIFIFVLTANIILWTSLLFSHTFGTYDNYLKLVQTGNLTFGQKIISALGVYEGHTPVSGLAYYITPPNLLTQGLSFETLIRAFIYVIYLALGSIFFSIFWIKSAGMDAAGVARQIINSGFSLPGYRANPRMLERILSRYITPITIMGALGVAVLAAITNLFGGLIRGTSLMLAITIAYQFYENILREIMDVRLLMDLGKILKLK